MELIGEGESAGLEILKSIFGDECEYKTQYPFRKLMKNKFVDVLSSRQEKETLDIVIFRNIKPTIVVRIQDKHHDGGMTYQRDIVQKKMLEWNDCIVLDLWYRDCPELWKDEVNDESRKEVLEHLRKANLI